MIKPAADCGIASPGISPVRGNSKHQITPLKTRRKTSRKDQAADVHATCSTPNRLQSENHSYTFNSPSDSFPCSQENHPDVIWDYTSPKLPKGSKKREIKITIDEFLKSLALNQAPECHTQNSHYIRLLEKWMAKQNTPVCARKPLRTVKRDYKMRSRRVFEEIKQFMESIQKKNEDKVIENNGEECTAEKNKPKVESPNHSCTSLSKKSFLEGDGNENDSIDELWGEADNSFIVKATQHLDVSCSRYNVQNKNLEILSTIPETICNSSNMPKYTNHEAEQINENNSLNNKIFDSDQQAQILFTQILSCDWDSDNEELENGFIMEDEALSLIPDEVLCGSENEHDKKFEETQCVAEQLCSNEILIDKSQNNRDSRREDNTNGSNEIIFDSESNRTNFQMCDISENELFNNFEDESFGDESILCKPEVLSWIDEVESKLSQSQKCTPEEIEKKKDEAIQRRKKNQSGTKNS